MCDCWLMLIRMSGWTASRETTHLLPGSSKRPDIRAHIAGHCVLFDVRTCTMTSGMGPAGLSHCAATPGHAAACGATAKHKTWGAPCQEMGYDFVALPIETGGLQSEPRKRSNSSKTQQRHHGCRGKIFCACTSHRAFVQWLGFAHLNRRKGQGRH